MRERETEPGDVALKGHAPESDYVGSLATRTRLKCLLGPRLFARLEEGWPHFSDAEMARRRAAIELAMAAAGVDYALLLGEDRKGSPLQWLTGWPAAKDTFVVLSRGARDTLFVKNPNNVPLASRVARAAEARWSPDGPLKSAVAELVRRGAAGKRVGVMGGLSFRAAEQIAEKCGKPVDLSGAYTRLRMKKSPEELDFLRIGAALSDLGVEALARELRPGLTEHELSDVIERAYVPWGGMTQIHYIGATQMAAPDCCVPAQIPSMRRIAAGDVVFTEIAATFWSYSGQVLRSFTVASEPTPLYRDLFDVAQAAHDAVMKVLRAGCRPEEVLDAASPIIDRAGFTICDDLLHGYGGGYLPPILGTWQRPSGPVPDMAIEAGMTVVVQPSVVTKDGKAGVQTGGLTLVTEAGAEPLQLAPTGFIRVG
jgi:Xaa-Pro aminopeptidase